MTVPAAAGPAQRLRAALGAVPRVGLAALPTPLQPMPRLTAHLDGPRLWVKRDDLTAGALGGGNKLRKLDVLLAEALREGADTLVSGGVVQSNSQRQVASAAARLGLDCHLAVFHGRVAAPGPAYDEGGNALLVRLFGATLHAVPWTGDRHGAIAGLADALRMRGRRPYVVPYGASSGPGAAGYASAALEIADQSAAAGFEPAAIVHCTGSAGTQAGLAVGAHACLPRTRVVGIDIDAEPARVAADVRRLADAAATVLGVDRVPPEAIEVVAGHSGPGYGVAHAATHEAMRVAGRLEGLVLDPVYAGKGLAGLISLVRAGRWRRDDDVVFVHTGGEPALFAYPSPFAPGG